MSLKPNMYINATSSLDTAKPYIFIFITYTVFHIVDTLL